MPHWNVSVLVGSLRQKSVSKKVARALVKLAPAELRCSFIEIGDLPLYNEDLEADPPAAFTRFRGAIAPSDALLFVTPEFNRGIPGLLKNAIDVGSRPWGKSVWSGKPGAVISQSYGALGGFGAHHQLRQVLAGVNVAVMAHPEAYLSTAGALFDEAGELVNDSSREFLSGFMLAFKAWIEQQRRPAAG
ncbi:MAG TPA: NADPH-dependent FMN reductase [Polyangiaceae bacterium]|jgi:chromate reductase|nr:NADPH-dependent FMN reductase [Polyangiaceae bacterium]